MGAQPNIDQGGEQSWSKYARRSFDDLPDHLVVEILVKASRPASSDQDDFGHFARMDKLCQLRTVCSSFDRVIPHVQHVLWQLPNEGNLTPEAVRYIKRIEKLKSLHLRGGYASGPVPDDILSVISGAASSLEYFGISGGSKDPHVTPDWQTHELFRFLAGCPLLKSLSLRCSAKLHRPLSTQYALGSLNKITLENITMTDSGLTSIFLVCPCIEEASLYRLDGLENPAVVSSTLKRLTFVFWWSTDLKIRTLKLVYLELSLVGQLTVNAPNLDTLVIDRVTEVVKEAPWKVATLDIECALTKEDLLGIFSLCGDAHVVRVQETYFDQVLGLSQLLMHFDDLQELEIGCGLSKYITAPQGDFRSLKSISKLRILKVKFLEVSEDFDLCLELVKYAPRLDTLVINYENLYTRKGSVKTMVTRYCYLQARYPWLNIQVVWPGDRDFVGFLCSCYNKR